MTFSFDIKDEIGKIQVDKKCCMLAELLALAYTCGSVTFSGESNTNLLISTENAATARRAFQFLKTLYNINTNTIVKKNYRLRKNNNYILSFPQSTETQKILVDMQILSVDSQGKRKLNTSASKKIIKKRCCKKAHIRGAFLGAGSISDPEKGYHLEIIVQSPQYADSLCNLLNEFKLNAKVFERKNGLIVYLKDGEHIVDFLSIIGAHEALLNFENVRVYKDVRNKVNRLVNCETANLAKTINASVRQIDNIKYISDKVGLGTLTPTLREIAEVRMRYKDANLRELGELLSPQIGKSGVNHRLRQIDDFAESLKRKFGD